MFPQDGQSRQWYCLRYCLHLSYSSNVREVKHKVLCVLIEGKYDQSIRFRQLTTPAGLRATTAIIDLPDDIRGIKRPIC